MTIVTINRAPDWGDMAVGAVLDLPPALADPLIASGEAVPTPAATPTQAGPYGEGDGGGTISTFTYAQLAAKAAAGTLAPYARYVASDIGEEFSVPDAYTLVPRNARVLCSLPGFNGTWDGTTDDTAAIQAAVDYAEAFVPSRAIELPRLVCIKNSVFIPEHVYVYGHAYEPGRWRTTIKPHASFSYSTGYMLNFNTLDGTTPDASIEKGASFQCGLFGVFFTNYGTAYANIRGAVFACTFIVLDVRQSGMTQAIKKVDAEYIDNIEIGRFFSWTSYDQSEYMIDIGGSGSTAGGDAIHIYNCNFPAELPSEPAIKLKQKGGVRITDVICGTILLDRCTPVRVENYHGESGQILCESSNVSIVDSSWGLATADSKYPIECTSTYVSQARYVLNLDNVTFLYGDASVHEPTYAAEVNLVYQYTLTTTNAYRLVRMRGQETVLQGLRLRKAGVDVDQWNDNSFYLSTRGRYTSPFADGQFTGVLGATVQGVTFLSVGTWGDSTLTTTTYYYKAQVLLDVDNLVGKDQTNPELSIAVTAGQQVVVSTGSETVTSNSRMLRLYRGTTTNSYDSVANVPIIASQIIIDAGDAVSGVAWIPRAAGAMDTLTTTTPGNYTVTPLTGAKLVT